MYPSRRPGYEPEYSRAPRYEKYSDRPVDYRSQMDKERPIQSSFGYRKSSIDMKRPYYSNSNYERPAYEKPAYSRYSPVANGQFENVPSRNAFLMETAPNTRPASSYARSRPQAYETLHSPTSEVIRFDYPPHEYPSELRMREDFHSGYQEYPRQKEYFPEEYHQRPRGPYRGMDHPVIYPRKDEMERRGRPYRYEDLHGASSEFGEYFEDKGSLQLRTTASMNQITKKYQSDNQYRAREAHPAESKPLPSAIREHSSKVEALLQSHSPETFEKKSPLIAKPGHKHTSNVEELTDSIGNLVVSDKFTMLKEVTIELLDMLEEPQDNEVLKQKVLLQLKCIEHLENMKK